METDFLPSTGQVIGWVGEQYPNINKELEIVQAEVHDDNEKIPNYLFITIGIRGLEIRLGFDTGSVRTLISEERWQAINADGAYQLSPQGIQLEAINGSEIECIGVVKLPAVIYGYSRNYGTTFKCYVIRNLGMQGLLGIDEICRNNLNINMADGTCWQPKVGQIHIHAIFREDYTVRNVKVEDEVILPPKASCDIRVRIEGTKGIGEGIIEPRHDIWKFGLQGCRTLTGAKEVVITRVINWCAIEITLFKGEHFGSYNPTVGNPMRISTVIEGEGYAECLKANEELEDPMVFEDFEDKKLEEVDFGIGKSELSEEQRKEARETLSEFKEVFQWDGVPVSFTHKIKHRISLKPEARPVKQKNRKFSEEQNKFIDDEVQKLINQDIIQISSSNWCSRIVLAYQAKKTKPRLCIDYRTVNALSVEPLAHPLPNIEQILDQFRHQSWFHCLDLFQGYHQCELERDSREITAFATRKGLFEFKRMPFGLNSCPTTYQALMESVLGELCWKVAVVYIDDVIIFGTSYEEAKKRLREVLQRLRDAKIKLRASKCQLFQRSVEFLGFVISNEGIKTCKHIVDAVTEYPVPTNVKQVQRFLGVCNYYRSFVKSHSQILSPIINLTRKGVAFEWTTECQQAMDTLKHKLVSAPIRNYYDPDLPVVIVTDASGYGIGATLANVTSEGKTKLLAYGSRTLKAAELSWSTTEKECFAIAHWVKKFRHYLTAPFVVYSDHNSLRFVSTMRDSSHKIGRWLNFLMQFSFEVHHRPGNSREMIVADVLSRAMTPLAEMPTEMMGIKMEKPILRLYRDQCSPILSTWFKIERPTIEDFDRDGELKAREGELPVHAETLIRKEDQLRIKLKRMQRETEEDNNIKECETKAKEEEEEDELEMEDVHKEVQLVNFILERKRENDMNFRVVEAHEVEDLSTV